MISSFEVIGKKDISLELQLPQAIKIHNVFHPKLFQKTSTDLLIGQLNKPAPLVIINNREKWEVEDILDARSLWRKIQIWGFDKKKRDVWAFLPRL